MQGMTWKEFKDAVDKKMKEKGIEESVSIWYIDISFPEKDDFEKETIVVGTTEKLGICIG